MEKWEKKIMIRFQFMFFIFHFPPFIKNSFPLIGGGGYSEKYTPLQMAEFDSPNLSTPTVWQVCHNKFLLFRFVFILSQYFCYTQFNIYKIYEFS